MQSPLPSSRTLESGLVPDPPSPYRMTGVQDTVRSLLRTSMLGRLRPKGTSTKAQPREEEETIHVFNDVWDNLETCNCVEPEMVAPPADGHNSIAHRPPNLPTQDTMGTLASFQSYEDWISCQGSVLIPSPQRPDVVHTPTITEEQSTVHQNQDQALATTGYSHPDLTSDNATLVALAAAKQEHSRYQPTSKSLNRHSRRRHHCHRNHCRHERRSRKPSKGGRIVYAIITGLVLVSLVATYLALVLSRPPSSPTPTTVHVVFILSIMTVTVLFCHAVVRLCLTHSKSSSSGSSTRSLDNAPHRSKKQRKRSRSQARTLSTVKGVDFIMCPSPSYTDFSTIMPSLPHPRSGEEDALPSPPISVHLTHQNTDDSDLGETGDVYATPLTSTTIISPTTPHQSSSLHGSRLPGCVNYTTPPPPAYGKWRGSIRLDAHPTSHQPPAISGPVSSASLPVRAGSYHNAYVEDATIYSEYRVYL